jgi:phosphoribosylaminoimidazole carboxylase (NCAIR synthetase)
MTSQTHFPTVGIIGAGQMARMLIEAASRLNIDIKLFSKDLAESAALIANNIVIGSVDNYAGLSSFAAGTKVVTFDANEYEFENLRKLEIQGQTFHPALSTIETLQNIDLVKKLLLDSQLLFKDADVNFDRELSIQVARSPHGQTVVYSVVQLQKTDEILTEVIAPAPNLSDAKASELQLIALKISEIFNIVGVFTVEFLDLGNDKFLISEIKLGPTNSGHWTIDGATTSQFENHLRAILDLPLGSPTLVAPITVMVNVLGGQYLDMYKPFLHCMAHDPKLRIHLYGKEVKAGRKVGHVNISGNNLEDLLDRAHHAADYLTGRITE